MDIRKSIVQYLTRGYVDKRFYSVVKMGIILIMVNS